MTLAYIFDHAVCCASAASSGRSLYLVTSQLDCLNHVRRTKSSIKKRIIVRRSVRSMFGEQTFAQLRRGLTLWGLKSETCCDRSPYTTHDSDALVSRLQCCLTLTETIRLIRDEGWWRGPGGGREWESRSTSMFMLLLISQPDNRDINARDWTNHCVMATGQTGGNDITDRRRNFLWEKQETLQRRRRWESSNLCCAELCMLTTQALTEGITVVRIPLPAYANTAHIW